MKYLSKKFSTPANSRAFVDNWDAIFGNDEPARPVVEERKELDPKFKTVGVGGVPFDI
jgi:hypothetical protein